MFFNSFEFFIFFFSVTAAYFVLPHRFRWVLLLGASYYFYMSWKAEYVILIMTSTLTAYLCALGTGRTESKNKKRCYLLVSLIVNLGILFTFKYFNFVSDSLREMLAGISIQVNTPALRVLLPVGISFYTFQTLSYTIDVYRGKLKPEKHPGIFALYVSFFPQLVAGPIERASHLLGQFYEEKYFDVRRVCHGMELVFWGIFKKVVIADRLAIYVDSVYNNAANHSGPSLVLATYFFAFQIYCDFSGYSDIAIGAAKVLGFDLMKNFNRPYFATNVTEFWHRWHISLSTWLRDYLYIPLGGNRKGKSRTYLNIIITMVLGGIWHGASWTFVIWGLVHGVMLAVSKLTMPIRESICKKIGLKEWATRPLRIFITFNLVCLCWIFFRANTVSDAFYIVGHLFSGWPNIFIDQIAVSYGIAAIAFLLFAELLQTRGDIAEKLQQSHLALRWGVYCLILFSIVLFGVTDGSQFIYFQF